ncbi:triokinase/FMN cyclase-like isoform X2 [Rhodnius prolixus]|uniref:triokinase/FMN cyclase-like isoform X2 n=1 Tax=Rhodnius prolixus TaxID=13249 RepID=UPI003D18804A
MCTKLQVHDKNEVEKEMLEAIAGTYPGLFIDSRLRIVMINRERKYRVALLSGGTSGHEPFPAGFVGEGMLTACIAGKMFSPPPAANILATIQSVTKLNKGGVLLLILNYAGDVLNFACAMETARTKGYKVECVIISDDVATYGTEVMDLTARRGMVGFVLVAKILGGLSKEGKSIDELVTVGRCLNCRLGTYGVYCKTLPGSPEPMFFIEKQGTEFGLDIHGEPEITSSQRP